MLADAHIHLHNLLSRDPLFPERLAGQAWTGCAASHDEAEYLETEALRGPSGSGGLVFVTSFGIHPQWLVWKNADFLARLAREGRIAAIGEAGFDFFGDRPERVRNPENEAAQRAVFEYQLGLAEAHGLPMILHLRKAMDLAFEYGPRLRRLRGAVFHSYSGTDRDAASLIARGIGAWFSFGAPILNGNKRSRAACAAVPLDRILAETDAPWQPPSGSDFCRPEHLKDVIKGMAAIRG
ncbi:MAG TPA: TatD family hydrolase, partial [Rectinemataceae bacterium]|nr:TatD family hydrolase [Rectinemataceae bacterium]